MAAGGLLRQANKFNDRADTDLLQDVGAVEINGLLADTEIERDVLVALAGNQAVHHLFLSLRQKLDSRLDILTFPVLATDPQVQIDGLLNPIDLDQIGRAHV